MKVTSEQMLQQQKHWQWAMGDGDMVRKFAGIEKEIAFHYGGNLTGIVWYWRDDHWGWVVKATINGHPMVSFGGAQTWQDAVEYLIYEIGSARLSWQPDKFAKKNE